MTRDMNLNDFSGSCWFIGTVTDVNEEEDLRVVEFGGEDNTPAVAVTVKELDRRCEEPELGDIVDTWFKFIQKGNMANEPEKSKEREEPILFCREANLCGTAVIEAQYYAPNDSQEKVKRVEERQERVHLICKYCLCNGVPVVYTKGGRKNWLDISNEKRKLKKDGRVAYLGRKQMKRADNF